MAGGIQFPNVANALLPLMQMDRQAERDKWQMDRAAKHDELMLQDRKEARALTQMQLMDRLDTSQRAKLKEAAEVTTQAALGVLNAPEAERPAAYQQALNFLKSRGHDTGNLPQQYSPGMDGMLKFYVQKAEPISEYFKRQAEMPQPMGAAGGISSPAPSGQAPNRDQFVAMMMPHALEVSKVTGLDPRLVIAQAALETGFGASAPGNNYFGIKSHNQPGGQVLATNEAGPGGGMVPTRASFRTYGDVGASARDYADFIKTNSRYAPVLGAQGLDAQIDAMGSSGYATDPQYGAKLRAIAQTIGGPQVAQAGGAPVVPQGDAVAGQGDVMTPPRDVPQGQQQEVFEVRRWLNSAFPGAVPFAVKGQPVYDAQKNLMVRMPDGSTGWVAVPKQKEPRQEGPKTLEERDREMLLRGDPADPAYAAAYAHLGAERVIPDPNSPGGFIRIRPDLSWARRPTFAGANAPQPATPPLPGGKEVQVDPGRGKPLDNSARDDLTKASGGVLELTELVNSFDPSFGGYMFDKAGDAANFAKRNLPDAIGGADPKGQAQWWQRYDMFANLERNKLFGSALTPGETAAFKAAMVSPGMKPEQIKANLERQREIASKALSRIANSMKAGGYNQEAIEAATGIRMGDMPDPIGSVPQGPPPGSPADRGKQGFELRKKYGLE